MHINRETYEPYFVDYLEGNLSDADLKILIEFLDENPDLQKELAEMTAFAKHEHKPFNSNKLDLCKFKKDSVFNQNESNFEELCIAFYENILSEKEEQLFLEMVFSNPNLQKTFTLYGKVYNQKDNSIVFPNKSRLKKRTAIYWSPYVSIAASVIILIGLAFGFNHSLKKNHEVDYDMAEQIELKPSEDAILTVHRETHFATTNPNEVIEKQEISYPKSSSNEESFNWDEVAIFDIKEPSPKLEKPTTMISVKGKLAFDILSPFQEISKHQQQNEKVSEKENKTTPSKANISVCKTIEQYNKALKLAQMNIPKVNPKPILGGIPTE